MSEHSDARTTEERGRPAAAARAAEERVEDVLGEAGRQARDLVGEAQDQLRAQTEAAQHRAAQSLAALAGELSLMAQRSRQTGPAADLVRQAGEHIEDASQWLDRRSPGDLVDEARSFARRRPGTFLLGAALLGAAAGRLTRGMSGRPARSSGEAGRDRPSAQPGAATAAVGHAPVPGPGSDGLEPGDTAGYEPAPAAVADRRPTVGEYVQEVERRTGAPLTAGPPPATSVEADRR